MITTNCNSVLTITTLAILLLIISNPAICKAQIKVKPGIDVLLEKKGLMLDGKRVGLITNPTGVTSTLESTIDVLNQLPNVDLVALFGPEHGVRGDVTAGGKIANYTDDKTGLPVYSLYGDTRSPTPEMLKNIDVLVYDIQDIGSRAYTYIYTMANSMESAAKNGISFVVLDRPNPVGGILVEGPVLDPKFKSFIGLYPIPYIYGLTVGELAVLFNEEFGIQCDLQVIYMEGWKRSMLFSETGLPWVPTSPHIPHAETALFCATIGCMGELGTVSEGVGYTSPFELFGAEWTDGEEVANTLNDFNLQGVHFRPLYYRPYYFRDEGKIIHGVQIHITDVKVYRPMEIQIHILTTLQKLYPEQKFLESTRISSFYKAIGTDKVAKAIQAGKSPKDIIANWQDDLNQFLKTREKYIFYK